MCTLPSHRIRSFLNPAPDRRQALILYLIMAVVVFLPRIIMGQDGSIRVHDVFDSGYGRYSVLVSHLMNHGLTSWLPELSGGMPVLADHVTQLHPLSLLSALFPSWFIDLSVSLSYALVAGYGSYRLFSEFFEVEHFLALTGGALFIFAALIHGNAIAMNSFMPLFPMVFVLLHGIVPDGSRAWTNLTTRALALGLIALFAYPILALGKFTILHGSLLLSLFFYRGRIDWKMILTAALFWTGLVLIFFPNFVHLLGYMDSVNREYGSTDSISSMLIAIPQALTRILLRFSQESGLMAVIIGMLCTLGSRQSRAAFLNLILVLSACVLFSKEAAPLISGTFLQKMDLGQCIWGLPLSIALVVAMGLSALHRKPTRLRILFMILCSAGMVLALLYWHNTPNASTSILIINLLTPAICIAALRVCEPFTLLGRTPKRDVPLLFGCLMLALIFTITARGRFEKDSYSTLYGDNPVLEQLAQQHQENPFRVSFVSWPPTVAHHWGLECVESKAPIFNKYFRDYFELMVRPEFTSPETVDRYRSYYYTLSPAVLSTESPLRADIINMAPLAAANVRYILSYVALPGLSPVDIADDPPEALKVLAYEIPDFMERAYVVPNAKVFPDRKTVLEEMGRACLNDFQANAYLAKDDIPSGLDLTGGGIGSAHVSKYEPDHITIDVLSTGPCFLMVSNNFDKSWKASVDDESVPLYRVNHAFQMIRISGDGTHRVELNFVQGGFPEILLTIPMGLLVIFAAPFTARRKRTNRDK